MIFSCHFFFFLQKILYFYGLQHFVIYENAYQIIKIIKKIYNNLKKSRKTIKTLDTMKLPAISL